jgi:tetratricopeptide (TPR) repeat protein
MVLAQEDLPLGMETATRYTLTQLYFQEERYQESVDMLDKWFLIAVNPGPESYVLKAQIYYQMEEYLAGIPPIQMALDVATQQGMELKENWYRLLNVFYYELEDYPNVIQVLRTIIQSWPKEEYFTQLSAMYGQEGDEAAQLGLYETAYEAGWLDQSNEQVQLSQLLLQAEAPIKAAYIMEAGLENGPIEANEANYRILAQAWQLAQEDAKAIDPLTQAAELAEDGELDLRLAQSYQNLLQWENCVDSGREALNKGELRREDQAYMIVGACLFEQKEYAAARTAFDSASEDARSRNAANSWVTFVTAEETRENELAAALAR